MVCDTAKGSYFEAAKCTKVTSHKWAQISLKRITAIGREHTPEAIKSKPDSIPGSQHTITESITFSSVTPSNSYQNTLVGCIF